MSSVYVIDNGESYSDWAIYFVLTESPEQDAALEVSMRLRRYRRRGMAIVAKINPASAVTGWEAWKPLSLVEFIKSDGTYGAEVDGEDGRPEALAFLEAWDKAGLGKRPWIDGLTERL
jgi:hypothetical protein